MTDQEMRVKQANDLLEYIEDRLILAAKFHYWEDRCRVADKIRELYKMAVEPRQNTE